MIYNLFLLILLVGSIGYLFRNAYILYKSEDSKTVKHVTEKELDIIVQRILIENKEYIRNLNLEDNGMNRVISIDSHPDFNKKRA